MEYALRRNSIVAAVVAVLAIGGIDPSKGPVAPVQSFPGKVDMSLRETMPGDSASEFRRAFKAATTAPDRRILVMKACEDELIHSHMSLDDLKKLFGDWPSFTVFPRDKETGKQSALLHFSLPAPPPPAGEPILQIRRDKGWDKGWYMEFFFEPGDDLRLYYLTNCGK